MTTLAYVYDALKLIGVIQETETPSAEQGADAVTALNDMMMSYMEDGIDLGYNPQSSTADSWTPPQGEREAIKYLLAVRLASNYGAVIPEAVALIASQGYQRLLRKAVLTEMKPLKLPLPFGEGDVGYRPDIENDS